MNRFLSTAISVLLILPLLGCGTAGTPRQNDIQAQPRDQIQQQQSAQAAPVNWTGDGGKGMSLTIYAPQETGLEENQKYLTGVIQRELVNEQPQGRALRYRRFNLAIFAYAGEQIPRTPRLTAPEGRGIIPQGATP